MRRGWLVGVAALLADDTDRTPEEWDAAVLALLGGAVRTEALHDGLGRAMADHGPGYFSSVMGMLSRDAHARWDIRPDAEAGEVWARRETIARALFLVARLDARGWPAIDPPGTAGERERQGRDIDDRWPWYGRDLAETAQRVGDAALYRGEVAILGDLLGDMAREDFHGADPMPPGAWELLDMAWTMVGDFADCWRDAGRAIARGVAWPAMLEVPEEWLVRQATSLRRIYREDD